MHSSNKTITCVPSGEVAHPRMRMSGEPGWLLKTSTGGKVIRVRTGFAKSGPMDRQQEQQQQPHYLIA